VYDRGDDIDRVVFFSDAVFAIAMTVLALSLHLPARTTDAGVAQALRDALPSVYTYALSFAVVGLYWLAHHRMFRCIRRFDPTLLVLNLAALGTVAFTPFPTSVLGNHGNTTAAVVFYAATMGLLGGLMTLLWAYASHDYRLISETTPRPFVSHTLWRSAAAPVVFIASIPIAFASPTAAEWFWLLLLLVRILLRRRYRTIFEGEPGVQ
jgi:uncharacterized membrane protein